MIDDRNARIAELFEKAVDIPPAERIAFLDHACGGDEHLRREIESLLSHDTDGVDDAFSEGKIALRRAVMERAVNNESDDATNSGAGGLESALPENVGRFRIIAKIADGGMGTVYLAEQDQPRRLAALKMIRSGALSPGMRRRFRVEAEVLGRLQHPGIAQIYEAGEIESGGFRQPYFAMEYVDGVELRRFVRENKLNVRERLELAARICDAVHHAHQKGVIHRDLKPENVLVIPSATTCATGLTEFAELGQPKVLDFGVARATHDDIQMTTVCTCVGQLVGTLSYMSPEQVGGDPSLLDARSDIYTLGAILYELLAGYPPFDIRRHPLPEAVRIIREDEPTRLGTLDGAFRGDIDAIVCKALEKAPERRYQTAAELATDIRRSLVREPIMARPPSAFYQLGKFASRNRGLVAGLLAAAAILVIGTAVSLVLAVRATRGEALARANERRAEMSEAAVLRANYRFNVAAADALIATDPLRAEQHLLAAAPLHRGWEWRLLQARIDVYTAEHTGDGSTSGSHALALGSDGVLIGALTRDGGVELVNLDTGSVRAAFEHDHASTNPILSEDGSRLAAFSPAEQRLLVWDVSTGELLSSLQFGSELTGHACFSPDGEFLAAPVLGEGLKLIEVSSGRVLFERAFRSIDNLLVDFDAAGERFIVSERRDGYYKLYIFSYDGVLIKHTRVFDMVASLAWSPDGALLALGLRERQISLLDGETLELRSVYYGHHEPVESLAFSSDGKLLASRSEAGVIHVVDLDTGRPLRVLLSGQASSLAFSRDGRLLAAGSSSHARLWEIERDACRELRGHTSYVYGAAFSPDGSLLATSAWDDTVRLWDPLTGESLGIMESEEAYKWVSFTPDGARLLAYDRREPGAFGVWDPRTGERLHAPRSAGDEALFVDKHASDDQIPRYDRLAAGGTRFSENASSPDGSLFARVVEVDRQTYVSIIDVNSEESIALLGPIGDTVRATAISPENNLVAVCGMNEMADVWEIGAGARVASLHGHVGAVYGACFSPDGTRIATAGNDGTVILWDAQLYDQVGVLRGHTSYVYSTAFSPDGTMLASVSGDGTVRVWDSTPPAERRKQIEGVGVQGD